LGSRYYIKAVFLKTKKTMPNPYFQFKQFTVWHDKCAMKVGTDGVLLGAWATANNAESTQAPDTKFHVLDIGTGTGLIAIMIAQRNNKVIADAIDIDKDACEQATENINKSPFRNRINVIHKSFTEYKTEEKYDLIVSNPPYFKSSLKSPDEKRNAARHNDSLPLKQLIEHAIPMLSDNGIIALILPIQLSDELDFIIATHKLYTTRRTEVVSVEGLQPKRFLIEISLKTPPECKQTTDILTLKTTEHTITQQYKSLTMDFYL